MNLEVGKIKKQQRLRQVAAILLIPFLVFGLLPTAVFGATESSNLIRYDFLNAFSGSGSLVALGDLTQAPVTTRNAAYGAAIASQAIGESRSFQFVVAQTGTYSIAFQGYQYFKAGIGELLIDGETIGTYDFYDPGSKFGPTSPMGTKELTAGNHIFTLKVTGRNPLAETGPNYSMYASALLITQGEIAPEVQLTAVPSRPQLLVGETAQMQTTITMSDGSAVTNPIFTYSTSNESVATVGGTGVITGVAAGTATITTTLDSDQGSASQTSSISIIEEVPSVPVSYNFLNAFEGSGNLFALGNLSEPPSTSRNRVYGAAISATAIGQSRSFQFVVPRSGHYLLSFKGYLYFSAGIGELAIDGQPIGTYDFYDPGSKFGPTSPMRTLELSEGNHIITFKTIGRNPNATKGTNYSMYASELILTPKQGPAVVELTASPTKSLLQLNETTQMGTTVRMSDGTPVTGQVISYTSDSTSIATINASGVITGIGEGTAMITTAVASDQGTASVTSSVTVTDQQLQEVMVSMSPQELYVGGTAAIMLSGKLTNGSPADLSYASATYSVDDTNIVTVSSNGIVTGVQIGQTMVRVSVTFNGSTVVGTYNVVVTPKSLASVELHLLPSAITVSQYSQATVTGTFDDGTEADLEQADIVFASSSPSTVTIDANGNLNGLQIGTAEVTATVTLGTATAVGSATLTVTELTSDKTRSTIYTPDKLANARGNAEQLAWATSIRDSASAAGDYYVGLGYEYLWNLVPPQSLPRSYGVNQVMGSPVTGREIDKFGNYPYSADHATEPWKLTDPSSGYKFPTNDFAAYYESGKDEHGVFRPELADRSLLVNTLYPEKGPTWGVDDGYGWVDENGNRYTFISYYVHWHLWYSNGIIQKAIRSLRDAYIYTGDMKYARAGIVLLDRIADIYPSLDASEYDPTIYLQSAQGTGTGKAVGSIWETSLVEDFVSAYDAFYPAMDDSEVISFLSGKGQEYKLSWKNSGTGLRRNSEQGIVKQVFPGVQKSQIRGNVGMHQSTLAMAAVVYDTFPDTKEWLDFNNQTGGLVQNPWRVTGGNMLTSLVNDVDRDGNGNESAPGYNRLWLGNYLQVADVLYGYDKYPQADLYENVKLQKMFHAAYPLFLSEGYVPSIGDSDSTGNPSRTGLDASQMIKAFEVYGDPIFAQMAHFLNNNSSDGIHSDIFSADPDLVAERIEDVVDEYGPLDLSSVNLSGYGFTALRDGENDKQKYGISYGFPQLEVTGATTAYNTYASTATVQLEATTAGHSIGFRFDVETAGMYNVLLKPFRASSYGIYRVSIDGQFVKEIDFFGTNKELELLQLMNLTAGSHTITFDNNGRGPSATNYKMGLTELQLLTQEEAESLSSQQNTLRDTWLYYGRSSGHGHRDTLNLGLHAYGLDLAPDLGYPEFADNVDMHRAQWVHNTVSHNTVVVDKRKQGAQYVGIPKHFDDTEQVKLIEVEAPKVYSQTQTYKRTSAMIRVDEEHSYTVDFFRVKGGNDHHFSFHSAEGSVTTEGLAMTAQPTGTYAGPNVPFGQRADDVEGAGYAGSGFHWLKDVERDENPSNAFSIDWNVKDTWNVLGKGAHAATDVHLRLTMLGQVDSIALANGVPPRNKSGNPEALRYMIAHRTGTNLDSLFTSVIEPYKTERYVSAISEAQVTRDGTVVNTHVDNSVRAVKVELANGRTDYIVQSSDPSATYIIDGKVKFNGFFGLYSEQYGQTVYTYVNDGSSIGRIGETPLLSEGALVGTVEDFTKGLTISNGITVQLDLRGTSPNAWIGRSVYIQNDGERNAVYLIKGSTDLGNSRYLLDIGDSTLVRRYIDSNDFSRGFVYDISQGAALRIPLSAERVLPVTYADVAGELVNGWYVGEGATVTLGVYGDAQQTLRSEYSLDGGQSWLVYDQPIFLTESATHTLQYRSLNGAGQPEQSKYVSIPVDRQVPTFIVTANGSPITNGSVLQDGTPIALSLNVSDPLSGVAYQSITITDATYGNGTYTDAAIIDWAGRPGEHIILVEATDVAGNTASVSISIIIATSLDSMDELLERYIASEDVRGPLIPQLSNSLMQARHHVDKGSAEQAAKHLEHFLRHLNNTPMQQHVSAVAKAVLAADAQYLIDLWL